MDFGYGAVAEGFGELVVLGEPPGVEGVILALFAPVAADGLQETSFERVLAEADVRFLTHLYVS